MLAVTFGYVIGIEGPEAMIVDRLSAGSDLKEEIGWSI
jgi:hypothetical protein